MANTPGLRLLGRGDAGDSEDDRLRDDCWPGIASSASSIIRFCTPQNTTKYKKIQIQGWQILMLQLIREKI